jgi:hypothetical protein
MVNPTNRIELPGETGTLLLIPDERGWTQVLLRQGDAELALGAETLKQIVAKFRAFLGQATMDTKWVLSFSELHFSIYGEYVEGRAILKFQDANGKTVVALAINPAQQREWLDALGQYGT